MKLPFVLFRSRRCALASLCVALAAPTFAAPAPWKFNASYLLKQSYDSNVYLQDDFVSVASSPAKQASGITSAGAALALEHQWSPQLALTAGYGVDRHWFWSTPDENHTLHRLSLGLTGRASTTTWSFQSFLLRTDGSSEAPIYTGPGGAPALGGAVVRDRRDALVTNATFKLVHTAGSWQLRPSASFNYQDFDTIQRRIAGCANYIDRSELFGGVDLAREVRPQTFLVLGYRAGHQRQYRLLGSDSPFSSHINRFLGGYEGAPVAWLQLSVLAGFDARTYDAGTPAGFDRGKRPLWADATATFKLSKQQTLALAYRRQTLPSASSQGIYDSSTWDLTWRNRVSERLTIIAAVKLARGDWMAPALREDRIVTPSLAATFALTPARQLEIGWSFDDALSRVPATSGREFRRHVVCVSFKQVL